MHMSETLTIRVSKNLKNELTKFDINWSQYLRETLTQKLSELRRKKVAEHMDQIMAKTSGKDIHMARDVIEWRRKH